MSIQQDSVQSAAGQAGADRRQLRRTYVASFIGSTIEFYDFIVYGTAASLVFGKVFFASTSATIGVIFSFATLAIGYAARPIGGIVFGHFGDRIGRKSVLIWTMSLMGASTFLIGCLPSSTQVGALAPILLVALRLVQGIAVGGEWGGAVLLSVEHAPQGARGFFGGAAGVGSGAGVLVAYVVFGAFSGMPEASFLAWGWRVPFLASVVMVAIGLYVRLRVEETPVFLSEHLKQAGDPLPTPRLPIVTLLRERPGRVLLALGVCTGPFMAQAIVTTTLISYATTRFGIPQQTLLNSVNIGLVGMLVTIPFFSWLSDKVGRRMVYVPSALLFGAFAFVMFPMVGTKSTGLIILAFVISMTILNSATTGPTGALMSESFPTGSRYTGASIAYQFAGLLGGGLGPFVAAIFVVPGGPGPIAVAVMIAVFSVISAVCTFCLRDTRSTDLQAA